MSLIRSLEKHRDIYLLNLILLTVYFASFALLNIHINRTTLFFSHDSITYLNVTHWIQGVSNTMDSQIRPFLYPAILLVLYEGIGSVGLWFFQFLCWIISINFIFLSIKHLSKRSCFGFLGSSVATLNFSFLLLTFHALPEVLTTFLLSVYVFFISTNIKKWRDLEFFHGSLLILVLLVVIKPLFYLMVLFTLLVVLPLFYLRKYFRKPRKFIVLFLILTPLILQVAIMKIKYDSFTVSEISGNTFRDYFFAQGLQHIDHIKYEEAVREAQHFSASEQVKFILSHKLLYLTLYAGNLKGNIDAEPVFLEVPVHYKSLYKFTSNLNTFCFYLHLLFLVPVFFTLATTIIRREYDFTFLFFCLSFPLYYILLTSGISFWQGDRLVLPGLPLWIFLYFFVIQYWRVGLSPFTPQTG